MHADLYWRCAVAVLLMPLASLEALARHHADLRPHLAPETDPEAERHATLVKCILPRFAMVCSTHEELEAAAKRKVELEKLKAQREAERAKDEEEQEGGVCV